MIEPNLDQTVIVRQDGFGWHSYQVRARCPRSGDILIKLGCKTLEAAQDFAEAAERGLFSDTRDDLSREQAPKCHSCGDEVEQGQTCPYADEMTGDDTVPCCPACAYECGRDV